LAAQSLASKRREAAQGDMRPAGRAAFIVRGALGACPDSAERFDMEAGLALGRAVAAKALGADLDEVAVQ
jgi:hypothetical protein